MKKFLSIIILCALISATFAACAGNRETPENGSSSSLSSSENVSSSSSSSSSVESSSEETSTSSSSEEQSSSSSQPTQSVPKDSESSSSSKPTQSSSSNSSTSKPTQPSSSSSSSSKPVDKPTQSSSSSSQPTTPTELTPVVITPQPVQRPNGDGTMTITMIPREGVAITDKALAAIKDPSKATEPKKSQVTTPNTINGLNTPSHDCSYKDNFNRTKVIIHVSKWNRDVVYYVDDNGVYYDESGAVCEKYNIGCSVEDMDQALEDAHNRPDGEPIGPDEDEVDDWWNAFFGNS